MNWPLVVFFLCFVLTFGLRIPIALRMIMSSIFYFALAPGPAAGIGMAATRFLSNMNVKFILLAVPLFVFAAKVMNMGEVTEMAFKFANTIVGKWRGVMGHVNVVASLCGVTAASATIGPSFRPAFPRFSMQYYQELPLEAFLWAEWFLEF